MRIINIECGHLHSIKRDHHLNGLDHPLLVMYFLIAWARERQRLLKKVSWLMYFCLTFWKHFNSNSTYLEHF